jgi:hypothetical protein
MGRPAPSAPNHTSHASSHHEKAQNHPDDREDPPPSKTKPEEGVASNHLVSSYDLNTH